MPALNFQEQFADRVASGEKQQTIRAWRKRPFRTGDKLFLYTGMRHPKACRELGEATASRVALIVIAVKDGQLTVVELKLHFGNGLFALLQDRARWADYVLGAVPTVLLRKVNAEGVTTR